MYCFSFQVTKSVLALLKYYAWRKFSIIYQERSQWEAIAEYLQTQALINDIFKINHFKSFKGKKLNRTSDLRYASSF